MKKSQHQLMNESLDGLTQAIGGISILIHMRSDYSYSIMREALQMIKDLILSKITCDASKTVITRKL